MTRTSIAFIGLLLTIPVFAEDERLSAEVLWQMERVGAPKISPNGEHVVVPVTTYPEDSDTPVSRLWLTSADGKRSARPITADGGNASDPVFSPDGSRLAFVSKRGEEEAGQIYVLPMDGPGEAEAISEVPTGASQLLWVGEHIYFASSVWPDKSFDEMAEALEAQEEKKVTAMVWNEMPYSNWDKYLDEARETHVYRIPADGGNVEALTAPTGHALPPGSANFTAFDVAPDESLLAFVADSKAGEPHGNFDLYLLEIGENSARNLTPDNDASDINPMFSPDGRHLAYTRQDIPGFYGDQSKLAIYSLRSRQTEKINILKEYNKNERLSPP